MLTHLDKVGNDFADQLAEQGALSHRVPASLRRARANRDEAAKYAMARLAVAETLTNLMCIKDPSLDSRKMSGNWMWAAKLEGKGPRRCMIRQRP